MKKIFSIPLIRGIVWQAVGLLVGIGIVVGIRLAMGLQATGPYLVTEHAWVFGGFLGTLTFLAGHGVMGDWFK